MLLYGLASCGLASCGLAPSAGASESTFDEEAARSFEHFLPAGGLPDETTLSLAQTRDGYLWVATPSGLGRFDGRAWRRLDRRTHPTLSSAHVTSLATDAYGYLWVGTHDGGLLRFDGNRFVPVSRPNQVGGAWRVTDLLQESEGTLWIGTPDDLLSLNPGATSATHGLPGIQVGNLAEDPFGHIWATAGRSLFRQVQRTFQTVSLPLEIPPEPVYDLAVAPDGVLYLARTDGLLRLRGDFESSGLPQRSERLELFAERPVRRLMVDAGGHVVVGADGEVGRFEDGVYRRLVSLPRVDGAPARVSDLFEDRERSLWIATDGAGLLRLETLEAEARLSVDITVEAAGERAVHATRFSTGPDTRDVSFHVAAPTFLDADPLRLRGRLEGHDGDWRGIEGETLSYSNLEAGDYRFLAEASLDGETWTRAELEVIVEPRLHETGRFWLWLVGSTVGLLALVLGWLWNLRRRDAMLAAMHAQEWRELQEESGLLDLEAEEDRS